MHVIKLAINLVFFSLFLTACGDTFRQSQNIKEENIFTEETQFKDYETNKAKWEKVETLLDENPNIDSSLTLHPGTKQFFRTIYRASKDTNISKDGYVKGTIFLKELREDDDGDLGELAGSTTVMIKGDKQWEFIKLTPDLNTTEAKGTQDGNDEITSVTACVTCHSQTQESNDLIFPFLKSVEDSEKGLEDFKEYKNWILVKESRGEDPLNFLANEHNSSIFRKIYKKQLTPKVEGKYPIGTMFLLELRAVNDDNATAGEIEGNITVMVKRGDEFDETESANNWEYFSLDANFTKILGQGNSSAELTKACFECHKLAQTIEPKKKNYDYVFPKEKPVIEEKDSNISKESLSKNKETL